MRLFNNSFWVFMCSNLLCWEHAPSNSNNAILAFTSIGLTVSWESQSQFLLCLLHWVDCTCYYLWNQYYGLSHILLSDDLNLLFLVFIPLRFCHNWDLLGYMPNCCYWLFFVFPNFVIIFLSFLSLPSLYIVILPFPISCFIFLNIPSSSFIYRIVFLLFLTIFSFDHTWHNLFETVTMLHKYTNTISIMSACPLSLK